MKTNALLPLLAIVIVAACHKTTPNPLISATINGHAINFNVSASAVTSAIVNNKDRSIFVSGYNTGNDSEQIEIAIGDTGILQPGRTYTSIPDSMYFNVNVIYKDAGGETYATKGVDLLSPHLPATAVITSLTTNHVQGTFTASIKNRINGTITLNIVKGTFDLPLTYSGDPNLPWK